MRNPIPIFLRGLVLTAFTLSVSALGSTDTLEVITTKPESATDTRYQHAELVLAHLLKLTEPQYGPAKLRQADEPMSRDRAFAELMSGNKIHVTTETAKPEWVRDLTPIWVPINKGITGYRICLIAKSSQTALSQIHSVDELKKVRMGSGSQWSTTKIMRDAGFNVIDTMKLEGLFWMLMGDRFQIFPRGINEAPQELIAHQQQFPDMAIEEHLAIYVPLPTFFFVSPSHPKLAERIRTGLAMMYADGSFDSIFYRYHMSLIEGAHLEKRQVFEVANPTLPPQVPLNEPKYWFKPGDELKYKY